MVFLENITFLLGEVHENIEASSGIWMLLLLLLLLLLLCQAYVNKHCVC